ncbi:MAG: hypothetical protein ACYSUN_03930 [Planctomycetota bacterium]
MLALVLVVAAVLLHLWSSGPEHAPTRREPPHEEVDSRAPLVEEPDPPRTSAAGTAEEETGEAAAIYRRVTGPNGAIRGVDVSARRSKGGKALARSATHAEGEYELSSSGAPSNRWATLCVIPDRETLLESNPGTGWHCRRAGSSISAESV